MIKILSDTSVKLCCNKNGCPVIELVEFGNAQSFAIKDDYENFVILSKEEILAVSEAAKMILDGNPSV